MKSSRSRLLFLNAACLKIRKEISVLVNLDANLVTNLKHHYAELKAGQSVDKQSLSNLYKQFGEATVRHFMVDFNKTLDLGMIKRKAADIGASAVIKAINIAADKIILNLNKDELQAMAEYHDTILY